MSPFANTRTVRRKPHPGSRIAHAACNASSKRRPGLYILLSILAIKIASERYHAGFAIFATYEALLILKYYMTVG